MYTLTIEGETILQVIDQLDKRINEFESLAGRQLRSQSPIKVLKEGEKIPAGVEDATIPKPSITPEQREAEHMKALVSIPITQTIEPTFANLKDITLDLAKAKGRNASLEVLKQFGVEKITALKVEQYGDAFSAMQKALE